MKQPANVKRFLTIFLVVTLCALSGAYMYGRSRAAINSVGSEPETAIGTSATCRFNDRSASRSSAIVFGQTDCPGQSPKLRYAPPALDDPIIINVPVSDKEFITRLDTSKDYIFKLPDVRRGPVRITGGRNVIMIGGHLHAYTTAPRPYILLVQNNHGIVHIEGIKFDFDDDPSTHVDAIDITAPDSTVQLQNIRVIGVRGQVNGLHGDIVQPFGGVKRLLIDRLTGTTNYQGLFLRPDKGPIGIIELNNIDLYYDDVPPYEGADLLWFSTDYKPQYGVTADSITLSNVYLGKIRRNSTPAQAVWPGPEKPNGPVVNGNVITWPGRPTIHGAAIYGLPPEGTYVPDSLFEYGYISPGYK